MEFHEREAFGDMLKSLAATLGGVLRPGALEGYWDSLKHYPLDAVLRAMVQARSAEKYFPKPARIIEIVAEMSGGQSGSGQKSPTMAAIKDSPACFCGADKAPGAVFCPHCQYDLENSDEWRSLNGQVDRYPAFYARAVFVLREYHHVQPGCRRRSHAA